MSGDRWVTELYNRVLMGVFTTIEVDLEWVDAGEVDWLLDWLMPSDESPVPLKDLVELSLMLEELRDAADKDEIVSLEEVVAMWKEKHGWSLE